MQRRVFVGGLIAGFGLTGPALADDVVDGIIRQLKKQGFGSVAQERTLLGRVRITAARKDGTREIILNPRTGEILRDLWTPVDGTAGTAQIISDPSDGGGSGHDGSGHDDDDGGEDEGDHDEHESGDSGGESGGSGKD
jgi:hypothetical protein